MTQHWTVTGPRVLDIGDEGDRVRRLSVTIIGGSVDVVTHDDSPAARIEVSSVEGPELSVDWDGDAITVTHGTSVDLGNLVDLKVFVKKLTGAFEHATARLSISVPEDVECIVTTISASALVAGVRAPVTVRTSSGSMTVDDTVGAVDVKTVSGDVACRALTGPLTVGGVSGSVIAHRSTLPEVKVKTVSGDVVLDLLDGRSSISSSSVSGSVTVRAPHDGADVIGKTMSGRVVVDGEDIGSYRGKGSVRRGDGSLQVKASSVSGDVIVLQPTPDGSGTSDAGGAASPEQPPAAT